MESQQHYTTHNTDIFIMILVLVGLVVFFVWFFWGLHKAKGLIDCPLDEEVVTFEDRA